MSHKQINISKEVYEKLLKMQHPGQSMDGVLREILVEDTDKQQVYDVVHRGNVLLYFHETNSYLEGEPEEWTVRNNVGEVYRGKDIHKALETLMGTPEYVTEKVIIPYEKAVELTSDGKRIIEVLQQYVPFNIDPFKNMRNNLRAIAQQEKEEEQKGKTERKKKDDYEIKF